MKIIDKTIVTFNNNGKDIKVEVCIAKVGRQGGGTATRSFSRLVRPKNDWDKFLEKHK